MVPGMSVAAMTNNTRRTPAQSDPASSFYGYDKSLVSPISCPDNVAFDSRPDHLWISTDGAPGTIHTCDGMFLMPTAGPEQGRVRQFLSVPAVAECCGPVVSWDPRPGVAHVHRVQPDRGRTGR